jgi:hypothetical protein
LDGGDDEAGERGLRAAEKDPNSEDWLDDLRVSSSTADEDFSRSRSSDDRSRSGESDSASLERAEIPEWLRDLGPIDQERQPVSGFEGPSRPEASQEVPVEESPPEEPPVEAADIPGWLRQLEPLEEESGPEDMLAPEGGTVGEAPEIPDWLRDLGPVEGEEMTPPVEESPEIEEPAGEAEPDSEEVPASLQDVTSSPLPSEAHPELSEPTPEEPISVSIEIPDWLTESPDAGPEPALPETLAEEERLDKEPSPQREVRAGEETVQETTAESDDIPSWFQEAERAAEGTPPEETAISITEEPSEPLEPPAWLTELLARAPGVDDEDVPLPAEGIFDQDEVAAGLARADIPQWLEDLQPVDAEDREAVSGPAEMQGLLRGLRGLLPVSSVVEAPRTHEGFSAAPPSKASLARAELLQSLLSRPIVGPEPRMRRSEVTIGASVERWVVASILLIAVLGTLLAPLLTRQVPRLTEPAATSDAVELYEVVDRLGATDRLLIAFDYGPPEADELNVLARPVLRHVIDQGVSVSIVSTRPDGPLIASALMSEIAESSDQYTLLGYRPGAAAAVSHVLTVDDEPPTLLLVLTSRPAPLRRWVEQARAHYGDQLPVVLAGSAALEPAASPFLDAGAGQLSGSIHGVSGAAAYEALRGLPSDATQRLNALAAGHLAIVFLMVVGATFYGLRRAQGDRT